MITVASRGQGCEAFSMAVLPRTGTGAPSCKEYASATHTEAWDHLSMGPGPVPRIAMGPLLLDHRGASSQMSSRYWPWSC